MPRTWLRAAIGAGGEAAACLCLTAACFFLTAIPAVADDVAVRPAAGSGFVVTDQSGGTERLRVNADGSVLAPGLAASTSPQKALCREASGKLVACANPPPPAPTCRPHQAATYDGTSWSCMDAAGVTTVYDTKQLECNQVDGCLISSSAPFEIAVSCPVGWWVMAAVCTKPLYPNLQATVEAPVFFQQNAARCTYTGSLTFFSKENLTVTALCVRGG